ncbi:MAG: 50S ribosomal protein L10 [Actinomycetota bacterium]|nr:50S ribosomal protein L10 [Actinomycetota bacterium]
MNKEEKAAVIEEIVGQIKEADAILAVDYRGISVPDAASLRARLRDADATFRVVKNSLTERAADQAGVEALRPLLDGPTALTFVRGDTATAAKALSDFTRGTAPLQFKGGLMDGVELTVEQIQTIARLPARDVLYAQLVGMVASPLSGLVRGLSALVGGLAIQLQQIVEQGLLASGEAPPDPEAPTPEASAEPEASEEEASEPQAFEEPGAADGSPDTDAQTATESDTPAEAADEHKEEA